VTGDPAAGAVWAPRLPIETERLRLRAHTRADLDDLVVFHGDPEVTRFIPWPVRTREQTAAALELKLPQAVATAEGAWLVLAVEERLSDHVVGEVLLKRADDAERLGEVGYAFATAAQGRGIASEAVGALLDLGFEQFRLRTIIARVEPANLASARLLERLGFERDGATEIEPDGTELLVFRRSDPT